LTSLDPAIRESNRVISGRAVQFKASDWQAPSPNWPQQPKRNQPQKGANDATRQSRNETGKADKKITDRKMGFLLMFLSPIFLSAGAPVSSDFLISTGNMR
jgi:hypothetical protein